MNNISCDVIQDLMPVYIEHMCSTESRKLVEAHMAECEGCRQVFRAYTDETIVREVSRTEAHAEGKENEFHQILKNVENKVIKRVAVIAVIIVSFAGYWHYKFCAGLSCQLRRCNCACYCFRRKRQDRY